MRRRGVAGLELAPDLAERAEPLGDHVVLVDRLEVHLAGGRRTRRRRGPGSARRRRGSSRARSPRRSGGGGAPSRRRGPRRSASSARRSPRTSTARRSRAGCAASISSSHSSVQPMCSVPSPRWLWVATGTASRILLDLVRRRSPRRRAARARRAATSSCAHGHAVMPWAVTPISRRVPSSLLTAEPCSVYSSCVWIPDTGAGLCSGKRASTLTSARRAPWRSRTSWAMCSASVSALNVDSPSTTCADRLVDDLLEARHVRALLVRAELDDAFEAGREQLLGAVVAEPDHLLDAGHADPGEAQLDGRQLRLDVDVESAAGRCSWSSAALKGREVAEAAVRPPRRWTKAGLWYHSRRRIGRL